MQMSDLIHSGRIRYTEIITWSMPLKLVDCSVWVHVKSLVVVVTVLLVSEAVLVDVGLENKCTMLARN